MNMYTSGHDGEPKIEKYALDVFPAKQFNSDIVLTFNSDDVRSHPHFSIGVTPTEALAIITKLTQALGYVSWVLK